MIAASRDRDERNQADDQRLKALNVAAERAGFEPASSGRLVLGRLGVLPRS